MECSYCGTDLATYEPLVVEREVDRDRVQEGVFCNYACLSARIDDAELTSGEACVWTPDE